LARFKMGRWSDGKGCPRQMRCQRMFPMSGEWQRIETAPNDGSFIVTY